MRLAVLFPLLKSQFLRATKITIGNHSKQTSKQKTMFQTVVLIMILTFFYTVIFGGFLWVTPQEMLEQTVSNTVLFIIALFFVELITTTFSIVYESNDLLTWQSYPIYPSELLVSKVAAILLSTISYIIPLVVVVTLTGVKLQFAVISSLFISLILVSLFVFLFILCAFVIVSFLARTAWFRRFHRFLMPLIVGINMVTIYSAPMILRYLNAQGIPLPFSISRFIYTTFTSPFSLDWWIDFALLGTTLALLLTISVWKVLPSVYSIAQKFSFKPTVKKRVKNQLTSSLIWNLVRYNVQLLKNSSTLLATHLSNIVIPVFILA